MADLAKVRSMLDVFCIVRDECTIFNYKILKLIAGRYALKPAFDAIDQFAEMEETYRTQLQNESFINVINEEAKCYGSTADHKLRFQLLVEWHDSDSTLYKFQELLKNELKEVELYFNLSILEKGLYDNVHVMHWFCYY